MRCSIYLSVMKSCRRKRKEALKSESRQDVIKERLAGMLLAKLGPANPPRHIVVTIGARSSVTHQIGLARMVATVAYTATVMTQNINRDMDVNVIR